MFWNYEEWINAFIIQFFAIIISFIVGKKNKIENSDIFLVVSLVCPVAIFNISAGVAGAVFLSDLVAIYLLFQKNNPIKITKFILLAFVLYIVWPFMSTFLSLIYLPFTSEIVNFQIKIFSIQFIRYFLYFSLLAKFVSKPFVSTEYVIKLFKVQSIVILFVFTAILLGYLGVIKVDPWNVLINYEQEMSLGKGGMFLYRGGVGAFGTISIVLVYFCYINGKGFYKYLMSLLIYIILVAVLFSGSRQGITVSVIALLLSLLLFKQYKKAIQILFTGFLLILLLLQNDSIREASDWVFVRYSILLDHSTDVGGEIGSRNSAVDEAKMKVKGIFYDINGYGIGSDIVPTESDYYNTYSYFGIIGLIIYIIFILYCIFKIYINWKNTTDAKMKNIFLISLIIASIMPLYGFQQWYVMTYGSANSMNVYLILFILSLGLQKKNIINYDSKE
jgi:hypothetical protein